MDHYSNCHHKAAERKNGGKRDTYDLAKGLVKIVMGLLFIPMQTSPLKMGLPQKNDEKLLGRASIMRENPKLCKACIFPRFAQLGYKLTIFLFTEFVIREFIRFG